MKLVKTYAWEDSFMEKIHEIRESELALYTKQTLGKALGVRDAPFVCRIDLWRLHDQQCGTYCDMRITCM